jgi:hemerythrin-like domain-containing protein
MNAVKMLKEDHQKVKGLFKEYEAAGEKALQKKKNIAEKVFMELEVHAELEEQVFYPAVHAVSEDGRDIVAEARQEHKVVKSLIEQLKNTEIEEEEYDAAFKVLMENTRHHIEEEEGEMFPIALKLLKEELEPLGAEMQDRKKELIVHVN